MLLRSKPDRATDGARGASRVRPTCAHASTARDGLHAEGDASGSNMLCVWSFGRTRVGESRLLTCSPLVCVRTAHMGPNCGAKGAHYDHRMVAASRWKGWLMRVNGQKPRAAL